MIKHSQAREFLRSSIRFFRWLLTNCSLINVLKAANQPVPDGLLKFGTTVKKKGHDAYGAFYKQTGGTKAATKIKFDD